MSNATFEQIISRDGKLIYTNKGDSMMPLIKQDRDLLVISRKPAHRLKKYDVPLYKRDSGQYVLHRILEVRPKDYVICGDNRWSKEYGIQDRHIIGVLTAVIRNGKEIKVTDLRYRLYVHLWCDLFPVRALMVHVIDKLKRAKRKIAAMNGQERKSFFKKYIKSRPKVMSRRIAYLYDGMKDLRICGCSLVKYVPSLYRESMGATGSQSTCYWALDKIFKGEKFSRNDSFIDVGCGKGRVLAYMQNKGYPCSVTGIELNKEVASYAKRWARKYENITVINGNAFELDYNDYTVLFMGRPFETEMFHKFIDQLEVKLRHPIRLFYWCDTQSGDYLENRKGWTRKRREMIQKSHGLYMYMWPQGFSLWEYTPQDCND